MVAGHRSFEQPVKPLQALDFSSEMIYAAIILVISFLDFQTTPLLIIGLILCSFIASATQDIATDALAVISFSRKNKSLVTSMQSMGSFAGAMVGGGLLLLIYNRLGWETLLPFLALFTVISIFPLIFFKERHMEAPIPEKKMEKKSTRMICWDFLNKRVSGGKFLSCSCIIWA
jgi:MFS family permease